MRVLAVCAGNICRSPAAEAAIREAAEEAGVVLDVDSAGTGSWHIGEPPHPEAVAAGARVGLMIDGRARKFTVADYERFDAIVVMDRSNLRDVLSLAPSLAARAKVRLFRTYDPASEEDEVPDPWGGPEEGYRETMDIVRTAAAGMIASLVSARVEDPVTLD
ncbi:MAG TPA: low molecular weight protein-tyrosine-phosphatase [Acidimicrobiia bacterium]